MGKVSHEVFETIVKEISQYLPPLNETSSKGSHFIPEPRNFSEVAKISEDINKSWLKATQKDIKNIINNQTFIVQEPEKCEPVTPCMDVYKAKIQSDGSLDKLKLGVVVRGDLQNRQFVGDTWSPRASMMTLKYFWKIQLSTRK